MLDSLLVICERECMGIEPTDNSPENHTNLADRGAESGALRLASLNIDPGLAALIQAWPTLTEAIRSDVLQMIGEASR